MLKVGIITIQRSSNYGACLQCYALYKYIESAFNELRMVELTLNSKLSDDSFVTYSALNK